VRLRGADDPQTALRDRTLRRSPDRLARADARAGTPLPLPDRGGVHRLVAPDALDLRVPRGGAGVGAGAWRRRAGPAARGGDAAPDRPRCCAVRAGEPRTVHRRRRWTDGTIAGAVARGAVPDDHGEG